MTVSNKQTYSFKIDKAGRILLHAAVRRSTSLRPGQSGTLSVYPSGKVELDTAASALFELRDVIQKHMQDQGVQADQSAVEQLFEMRQQDLSLTNIKYDLHE